MTTKFTMAVCLAIILMGASLGFAIGRHHYHQQTVKWYSDMTSQIQGRKIYLIDTPVVCPNRTVKTPQGIQMVQGKEIGKIQIDINLQNGQLKVVTNTVPNWVSCEQ